MKHPFTQALSALTAALIFSSLTACGGGGGGDNGGGSSSSSSSSGGGSSSSSSSSGGSGSSGGGEAPPTETGVFVDSLVANIGYRSLSSEGNITHEGVTDANGEFGYEPGDSVVFFIGDLEFPAVAASEVITPLDIAGTTDTSDNSVVNMARLLQTLDTDGDPSNGILISDAAVGSKDPALDAAAFFDQSPVDFASSAVVKTLIENGGQDTPTTELVSADSAQAHLETTLESEELGYTNETSLTGGWVLDTSVETGNGVEHFIFLAFDEATGNYIHVEEKESSSETEEGLEWGAYSLDAGKVLKVTANFSDENGGIGLHDPEDGISSELQGEYLTFDVEGNSGSVDVFEVAQQGGEDTLLESIPASRVVANGLQGAWVGDVANSDVHDGDLLMLAFLPDGTYVQAEDDGVEVGSYSHDMETGVLSTSGTIVDTNGYGFSSFVGTANLKLFVRGNSMTMQVIGEGEIQFNRLGAGPAGIQGSASSGGASSEAILIHDIWDIGTDQVEEHCEEIRWVGENEIVKESDATGEWKTVIETIDGEVHSYPDADFSFISAGLGKCPARFQTEFRCADDNFITYEETAEACTAMGGELL
ncbi:hypothetical protein [Microbulbifer sp.]|uniref:hypothetical protein n=1 Tax=Microbulbifer sp. TaxID=1908541 RepID=UPI0025889CAB|nr:hypothetical protein [Microbulbifer sp.]